LGVLRAQARDLARLANEVVRPTGEGPSADPRLVRDIGAGHPAWLAARKAKARLRAQAHRASTASGRAADRLVQEARWVEALEARPHLIGAHGITRRGRDILRDEPDGA